MAKLKDKTKIGLWISKEDKETAEEIIHSLGLTSSEVVRLLYKQIILQRKLPFDIKLSNISSGPKGFAGDVLTEEGYISNPACLNREADLLEHQILVLKQDLERLGFTDIEDGRIKIRKENK